MDIQVFWPTHPFDCDTNSLNCQARLLLVFAPISKLNSQSLNSETKGAELTL